MPHLFDLNPTTLGELCAQWEMPRHTAAQVFDWVYAKKVIDPARFTNISARNRTALAERLAFYQGKLVKDQRASDGTRKLLVGWPARGDGEKSEGRIELERYGDENRQVECVMIPSTPRATACLSSQMGCPVGCRFCASGIGGLEGNLTTGQIVEQAHRLNGPEGVERLTNIVFMGMGEPLANFSAVTNAIRTINGAWALGISARKITVSTVGLPGAIRKLVQFELPVTLALSLHAPNDDLRRQLIPWAEYTSIKELMSACDEYFQKTGREITLEYILLHKVNDQAEHARELAEVAAGLRANVNMIRYNEVAGLGFERPRDEDVLRFQAILRERGINTHIRASRGRDIAAACGQLRHEARGNEAASKQPPA